MTEKSRIDNPVQRADKWLWSVRLFKTRSLAAEACRKGKISIDNIPVKPSRLLKEADIIRLQRPPVLYTYRVKGVPDRRLPAKLVNLYLEDLTPAGESEKLTLKNLVVFSKRDRGSGRPTKKERRLIDRLRKLPGQPGLM
jgi:ribosome-associated heat shock protein Hsp15